MSDLGKCLITGVSGFVGKALAKRLVELGYKVIGISRRDVPELKELGVEILSVDITSSKINPTIFKDVKTVFHVAAKVDMWGKWSEFYETNFLSTQRLLLLAKEAGVKNFIYTSSPSVIADGTGLKGVNESYPYPKKFHAHYPHTKALAEKLVLSKHTDNFRTIALRPHLIFGPNDTGLTPTIIDKAKKGDLMIVGGGKNLVDFTFIDDCVEAHIQAAKALDNKVEVGGQPYFISQGDPYPLWKWVDRVLELHGVSKLNKKISFKVAYSVASILEVLSIITGKAPKLSKFLVQEMATDHYFCIDSARKNLDYSPRFTVEEAINRAYSRK